MHVVNISLFVWQAVRVLTALLTAVDVNLVESPRSASDFSLATTPRFPHAAEQILRQDSGMYDRIASYSQPACNFVLYVCIFFALSGVIGNKVCRRWMQEVAFF